MSKAKKRRRVRGVGAKLDQTADRYPCGDKRRADEARQAREARARVFGMPEHAAGDALAGTAYGRLALRGALHPDAQSARRMCEVCDRVLAAWTAYERAIGVKRLRAAGLEPRIPGESDDDTSERDERAVERWLEIRDRLREYPDAWRALLRLVVEGVEVGGYEIVNARLAINSLDRLWKLTDGR